MRSKAGDCLRGESHLPSQNILRCCSFSMHRLSDVLRSFHVGFKEAAAAYVRNGGTAPKTRIDLQKVRILRCTLEVQHGDAGKLNLFQKMDAVFQEFLGIYCFQKTSRAAFDRILAQTFITEEINELVIMTHNHSHAKIVPFDIVGCNRVRIDCLHTFVGADECIPIVYDGVPICRLFAKDLSVAVLNNAGLTDIVRHIRYTFVLG